MSHSKERKEKNCLNCNALVHGRYCHICGQENLEPAESVWHLTKHIFNDFTHFDGKFFNTVKYILTRPGFLSREYMAGRRASYLNPVRMYLFTSALFFLITFNFLTERESTVEIVSKHHGVTLDSISKMDSIQFKEFSSGFRKGEPRTKEAAIRYFDSTEKRPFFTVGNRVFATEEDYSNALKKGTVHDGWLAQKIIRQDIAIRKKYNNNQAQIRHAMFETLIHSFPQMLFVSLPFFALLLKLLYVRRRNYYYTNHLIFSLNLYIFYFIILLITFSLEQISKNYDLEILAFIYFPLNIYSVYYFYKSIKNFYQQGFIKTIIKILLLLIMFAILIGFITGLFAMLSLFKI